MPRDGSGNYTQPFPNVDSGTTIESTVYNGFVADVSIDLNEPRPIIAGGTGATNATDALDELGGEHAQQVVTNYNSHVFLPGSFYSAASATGGPVDGHGFSGICYVTDATEMFIEARDHDDTAVPARKYVREKDAGVWGSWTVEGQIIPGTDGKITFTGPGKVGISNTVADMFYGVDSNPPIRFMVNTESDGSGTDALIVSKLGIATFREVGGNATIQLNKTASTRVNDIRGLTSDVPRWIMRLGNEAAETGSGNSGSDFALYNCNDAGSAITTAMHVFRSSGNVSFGANVSVGGALTVAGNATASQFISSVAGTPTQGTYWFGNSSARLNYDGANWNFDNGGAHYVSAYQLIGSYVTAQVSDGLRITVPSGGPAARVSHTVTGVRTWATGGISNGSYWISDISAGDTARFAIDTAGTVNIPVGLTGMTNGINVSGGISVSGALICGNHISQTAGASTLMFSNGYRCKDGFSGGGYRSNSFIIDWNGTNAGLYIDSTLIGLFSYVSDYRTKKDIAELPSAWDKVKTLRPIKYTQKEFSPPSHLAHNEQMKAKASKAEAESEDAKFVEAPLFKADTVEQWGFVAHELQQTLTASAANGVKDDPKEIQSPNPWTVIAALTKALQEAMARIEALEAK